MKRILINKKVFSFKNFKILAKRNLAFLVASPLAILTTSLIIVGGASAAVLTYNAITNTDNTNSSVESAGSESTGEGKHDHATKTEEPSPSPSSDPNHQDLAPDQYKDTTVSRDSRYWNIHDMGQSSAPQCTDGWNYISPNGDMHCMAGNCRYAYITQVRDGVDETTVGLSKGVRQGVACSTEATKTAVLDKFNVVCQDGTQSCLNMIPVANSVSRNPNYIPPNGQE